jgi:hypothetical protein
MTQLYNGCIVVQRRRRILLISALTPMHRPTCSDVFRIRRKGAKVTCDQTPSAPSAGNFLTSSQWMNGFWFMLLHFCTNVCDVTDAIFVSKTSIWHEHSFSITCVRSEIDVNTFRPLVV